MKVKLRERRFPPRLDACSFDWRAYFSYLWSRYRISEMAWRSAYKRQRGHCAICKKKRDRLVTDHDHKTKRFRGLLCHFCNGLLGKLEKHEAAIRAYLNPRTGHGTHN